MVLAGCYAGIYSVTLIVNVPYSGALHSPFGCASRGVSQCVELSEVCSLVYCLSSWIVSVVFL